MTPNDPWGGHKIEGHSGSEGQYYEITCYAALLDVTACNACLDCDSNVFTGATFT